MRHIEFQRSIDLSSFVLLLTTFTFPRPRPLLVRYRLRIHFCRSVGRLVSWPIPRFSPSVDFIRNYVINLIIPSPCRAASSSSIAAAATTLLPLPRPRCKRVAALLYFFQLRLYHLSWLLRSIHLFCTILGHHTHHSDLLLPKRPNYLSVLLPSRC